MANGETFCKYPEFIEKGMRRHKEIYGHNPGLGAANCGWVTVPLSKWVDVNRRRNSWRTRYGRGYSAGYSAGLAHGWLK